MTELLTHDGGDHPQSNDSTEPRQGDQQQRRRGRPGGRPRNRLLTVEELLLNLAQLAGAVAMGIFSPAQANTIKSVYAELLRHQTRPGERGATGQRLAPAALAELVRRDPQVADLIAPLLDEDQLAVLMRAAAERDDGEA